MLWWLCDPALILAWNSLGWLTSLITSFWKLFAHFLLVFLLPFWPFLLNPPPLNSMLVPHKSFPDSSSLANFSNPFVLKYPVCYILPPILCRGKIYIYKFSKESAHPSHHHQLNKTNLLNSRECFKTVICNPLLGCECNGLWLHFQKNKIEQKI